jgi:hypothetical protein
MISLVSAYHLPVFPIRLQGPGDQGLYLLYSESPRDQPIEFSINMQEKKEKKSIHGG